MEGEGWVRGEGEENIISDLKSKNNNPANSSNSSNANNHNNNYNIKNITQMNSNFEKFNVGINNEVDKPDFKWLNNYYKNLALNMSYFKIYHGHHYVFNKVLDIYFPDHTQFRSNGYWGLFYNKDDFTHISGKQLIRTKDCQLPLWNQFIKNKNYGAKFKVDLHNKMNFFRCVKGDSIDHINFSNVVVKNRYINNATIIENRFIYLNNRFEMFTASKAILSFRLIPVNPEQEWYTSRQLNKLAIVVRSFPGDYLIPNDTSTKKSNLEMILATQYNITYINAMIDNIDPIGFWSFVYKISYQSDTIKGYNLLTLNEQEQLFEIIKNKAIKQEPIFNKDLKHIDFTLVKDISHNKANNVNINGMFTKFNGTYEVSFINNRDSMRHMDILLWKNTNCAKHVLNEYIKCKNVNHCSFSVSFSDNDIQGYRKALNDIDQKTIEDNRYKQRKMKKMKMKIKKNIQFNNNTK